MWATMTKDKISMANFDGDDGDDDDYVNDGDDDERQDIDGWVRCQLAQSPYSLAGGNICLFVITIIIIIIIMISLTNGYC